VGMPEATMREDYGAMLGEHQIRRARE
jgi:hypothetical protein